MAFLSVCIACKEQRPPEPEVTSIAPPAREGASLTPRAKLKRPSGSVRVKRAAGDDWLEAKDDTPLAERDNVRTGAGASALLEFNNGSVLTLGGDALISIADTSPSPGAEASDVTVLKGRVDARLDDVEKGSLQVRTPAATVRAGREILFQ
jgi:hypothetical protein